MRQKGCQKKFVLRLVRFYVVTDATRTAPSPLLDNMGKPATRGAGLTWRGQGRVFQVERADLVTGLLQPLSPILPDLSFDDPGARTNRAQSY